MMESAYQTFTTPVEILTYVDDDDYSYNFGDSEFWPNRNSPILASVVRGPRLVMSEYWNVLAKQANGDILVGVVTLNLGEHEYKFVVNGEWTVDPANPNFLVNALGTLNSVVQVS